MSVTVKATLMSENEASENRMFSIHEDKDGMHNFLRSKISDLFSMKTEDFKVFWKDSDGDMITVSSDEEINDAVKRAENSFLRIYIAENGKPQNKDEFKNKLLTCGECKHPIYRKMFKCLVCPELAICKRCEKAGSHSEHRMIKLSAPLAPWRHRSTKDCVGIDRPFNNQFESFRQYRASRERRNGYRQKAKSAHKSCRGESDGVRCQRRKDRMCQYERKYSPESWKQGKSQVRELSEDDDKGDPLYGKGRAYGCTRRRRDHFRQIPEARGMPFEKDLDMPQNYAVHPFRRNKRTSHGQKTPLTSGCMNERIWTLPRVRKFLGRECHHEGVCKTPETKRNKNETRKCDQICGSKQGHFKDALLLYPCWAVGEKSRKIRVLKNNRLYIKDNGNIRSHSITQNYSDEEETRVMDVKTFRVGQHKIMRKVRSPKSRCKSYVPRRASMDMGYARKCPTPRRASMDMGYVRKCPTPRRASMDMGYVRKCPTPRRASMDMGYVRKCPTPRRASMDMGYVRKCRTPRRAFMDMGYVRKCPTPRPRPRMCNRHMNAKYNRRCHEKQNRKCINRCHSCPPTIRYSRVSSGQKGYGRVVRKHPRVQPFAVPHRDSRLHPQKRKAYRCSHMKRMSRYYEPERCAVRFHTRNPRSRLLYRTDVDRICHRRGVDRTPSTRRGNNRNKVMKSCRTRKQVQGLCTRQRNRRCLRMHATPANRQKRLLNKRINHRRIPCLANPRRALRRPSCTMVIPINRQRQYRVTVYNTRNLRRFLNKATLQCCRKENTLGHRRYKNGNTMGTRRCGGRRNELKCSLKSNKRCNYRRRRMTKKYSATFKGLKAKRCRGIHHCRFEIGNVNRQENVGEMNIRGSDKQIRIVPKI